MRSRKKYSESHVMKVQRIVANVEGSDFDKARDFYQGIFGLNLLMDLGWINTFGSKEVMPVQISVASEGGSGTPVPELSFEVTDLEAALERAKNRNIKIEYGPVSEPWKVKRFFIRDPFGKLINVLEHEA